MCCAPIVYMFVYILIGAHIVPLNIFYSSQDMIQAPADLSHLNTVDQIISSGHILVQLYRLLTSDPDKR